MDGYRPTPEQARPRGPSLLQPPAHELGSAARRGAPSCWWGAPRRTNRSNELRPDARGALAHRVPDLQVELCVLGGACEGAGGQRAEQLTGAISTLCVRATTLSLRVQSASAAAAGGLYGMCSAAAALFHAQLAEGERRPGALEDEDQRDEEGEGPPREDLERAQHVSILRVAERIR